MKQWMSLHIESVLIVAVLAMTYVCVVSVETVTTEQLLILLGAFALAGSLGWLAGFRSGRRVPNGCVRDDKGDAYWIALPKDAKGQAHMAIGKKFEGKGKDAE